MKTFGANIIGPPQLDSAPMRRGVLLSLFLIGGVTVLALGLVVYLNLPSLKRSILAELKSGNLTKAYDLYHTSKNGLEREELKEIAEAVLPAAESKCSQMITRLKQEAVDSDWSEATRLYSWMNELKPDSRWTAGYYFSQARLAFSRKDYGKAIENYSKSIELDPSSALALNGLGRAFWGLRDGAMAKDSYQRAIAAEPAWVYPQMNLGGLYLELNDYSAAEQTLRKALSLDGRKAATHNLLAQVYEKMSRWCDAFRHYSLTLETAGGDTSGLNIENARNKANRLQSRYGCTR